MHLAHSFVFIISYKSRFSYRSKLFFNIFLAYCTQDSFSDSVAQAFLLVAQSISLSYLLGAIGIYIEAKFHLLAHLDTLKQNLPKQKVRQH